MSITDNDEHSFDCPESDFSDSELSELGMDIEPSDYAALKKEFYNDQPHYELEGIQDEIGF